MATKSNRGARLSSRAKEWNKLTRTLTRIIQQFDKASQQNKPIPAMRRPRRRSRLSKPCPSCKGRGWIRAIEGCSNSNTPIRCPHCGGTGKNGGSKLR